MSLPSPPNNVHYTYQYTDVARHAVCSGGRVRDASHHRLFDVNKSVEAFFYTCTRIILLVSRRLLNDRTPKHFTIIFKVNNPI